MRVFKSEDMGKKAYVSSDFLNQVPWTSCSKIWSIGVARTKLLELFGNRSVCISQRMNRLLQRIIEYTTEEEDIVLDFHFRLSGTTASRRPQNGKRQYIGIEQTGLRRS